MTRMNLNFGDGGLSGDDAETGGTCTVPGWYRCVVEDVTEDVKFEGRTKFKFKITHGPHRGEFIYDSLTDPAFAEDEEKGQTAGRRCALFAKRLGLWDGQKTESLEVDWADAIGAEVAVLLEKNAWVDKETKEQRTNFKPRFNGIYGLDDERLPDEARKACGLATAAAAAPRKREEPAQRLDGMGDEKGQQSASGEKKKPGGGPKPKRNYDNL